jgi:hypothetical protein
MEIQNLPAQRSPMLCYELHPNAHRRAKLPSWNNAIDRSLNVPCCDGHAAPPPRGKAGVRFGSTKMQRGAS